MSRRTYGFFSAPGETGFLRALPASTDPFLTWASRIIFSRMFPEFRDYVRPGGKKPVAEEKNISYADDGHHPADRREVEDLEPGTGRTIFCSVHRLFTMRLVDVPMRVAHPPRIAA